jgi:hypothetical protein
LIDNVLRALQKSADTALQAKISASQRKRQIKTSRLGHAVASRSANEKEFAKGRYLISIGV